MQPDSLPEVVQPLSRGGSTVGKFMVLLLAVTLIATPAFAQSSANAGAPKIRTVPNQVKFSGTAMDLRGKPLDHVIGITFSLYQNQEGGLPLWLETQNVLPDKNGHYSVSLGATKPEGVSPDLFASGQAQWLGVQIEGQPEQPRVFLLSVPYALKAADAETIGRLSPSAFVLATPGATPAGQTSSAGGEAATPSALPPATLTGTGTTNFVPLWTSPSKLGNSALFQSGSGTSAKVGVNPAPPGSTLDIKGTTNLQGLLTSAASGAASPASGKPSQAHSSVASSFNSSTGTAVSQTFQWKAEPAADNTATPSGTLSLLFGSGKYWLLVFVASYWQLLVLAFLQPGHRLVANSITNSLAALGLIVMVWGPAQSRPEYRARSSATRTGGTGAYAFMRHRVYTAALLTNLGFLLRAFSPLNALLIGLGIFWFFPVKSLVEEDFLGRDPEYAAYMSRVRARWIPYLIRRASPAGTSKESLAETSPKNSEQVGHPKSGGELSCEGNLCSGLYCS